MTSDPSRADPRLSRWVGFPGVVALVTVLAFVPALAGGFVNWDDDGTLLENTAWRGLSPEHLAWMFTTTFKCHYHPLTWLSWGFDYVVWGMNPLGYHLGNVVIHATAAVLLYAVIVRLLRRVVDDPERQRRIRFAAVVGALFYAVHPLRVESVAWITERRDVLSVAFLLAAVLAWVVMADSDGRKRLGLYLLTLAFFLLSLLCKAWAMTFPVLLLVLDAYPLRRLSRRAWLEKLPFLAGAAVFAVIAIKAQEQSHSLHSLASVSLSHRVMQSFYGVVWYVWKTILPWRLGPMYEIPRDFNPWGVVPVGAAVLCLAGAGVALWQWKRRPFIAASLAWYVVALSPVLGIVSFGSQLVADRYSVIAALPTGALVAALLVRLAGTPRYRVVPAVASLAIGVLSALTFSQARIWQDSVSLWSHAIRVDPDSSVALHNLARAELDAGDLKSAVAHFQRSLAVRPANLQALISLSAARGQLGDPKGAIEAGQAALALEPENPPALFNVAGALQALGRPDEALEHFLRTVEAPPRQFVEARHQPRDTFVRMQAAVRAGVLCAAAVDASDCRARLARLTGHPDPRVGLAVQVARIRLGDVSVPEQAALLESLTEASVWPQLGRSVLDALNAAHAPEAYARLGGTVPAGGAITGAEDVSTIFAGLGLELVSASPPRSVRAVPDGVTGMQLIHALWPGSEPILEGSRVTVVPTRQAVAQWEQRLSAAP